MKLSFLVCLMFVSGSAAMSMSTESTLSRFFDRKTVRNLALSEEKPIKGQNLSKIKLLQSTCEPCPYYEQNVASFCKGSCFVIGPGKWRIRTVTCAYKSCSQFCPCGNSWCQAAGLARFWFYAYCKTPCGHWPAGFSFNYYDFPQDCKCRQSKSI